MTFTDPQGRTLQVNSPDGSVPSETELDQMFKMKYGNVAQADANATADAAINSRSSAIADLTKNPITIQHPFGAVLRTIGGANELAQGAISSVGLDLQRGQPQNIVSNLGKVASGQRPAQFGDLYQGAGLPKPLASAAGLATDIALTPGGTEGVMALGKGAVGLATGTVKNIGNFFNFDQKVLTLSDKVRAAASASHTAAVDKFGGQIDALAKANPTKTTDLSQVVLDINTNLQNMTPEAQSVFRKVPVLNDLLKDPSKSGTVSLEDTQKIINYINTKIPKSITYKNLDVLDAQNDIRAAQLDAFPEMGGVRQDYAQHANDYKLVRSALSPKSTPGAIATNFNGNPAVKDAASRILTPVLNDMQKYRNQVGTANAIKKGLGWAIGGAIGAAGAGAIYEGGKKLLGK